jgi:hypothetical protein
MYVPTKYVCTYKICMFVKICMCLQNMYVRTKYVWTYKICMYVQNMYVRTKYVCAYKICMYVQNMYVPTKYVCTYKICMYIGTKYVCTYNTWIESVSALFGPGFNPSWIGPKFTWKIHIDISHYSKYRGLGLIGTTVTYTKTHIYVAILYIGHSQFQPQRFHYIYKALYS